MSAPSASSPRHRRLASFLPSGRAWWWVAGAFAAGLLLFALVLSSKRDEFEFYRAEGGGPDAPQGQVFEPLPAPLPAGEQAASGMDERPPARGDQPRIDQHAPPPAVVAQTPAEAAPPGPAPSSPGGPGAAVPRPVSAPPPDYPAAALRAGITGKVTLRIEVDAQGRPGDVSVVASSRNRDLDRAAIRAVRRWRFEPAMREGVAVAGTVQQVISFDAPD